MSALPTSGQGLCYKFVVGSAEQAATLIREKLGPRAHVLSVRTIEASGLRRLWASPKLEVIARVEPEQAVASEQEREPLERDGAIESFPRQAKAAVPSLAGLLRMSGVSELALGRLQCHHGWSELQNLPLHRALVEVGFLLKDQSQRNGARSHLGRAAFIGTAGSGRTTALCKWLALQVFGHGRSGRVVAAEFDRPNPIGTLPMFCEALGVPFGRFAVEAWEEQGDFEYFDIPSISLRNSSDNAEIAAYLDREKIEQRVLVLNVAYDPAVIRAAYGAGRSLGATHVVFTHLDEVQQWGRVWEFLCDGSLEPLFLSTGPALTGEAEENVWDTIVRRTLASAGTLPEESEPQAPAIRSTDSRRTGA